MLRQTLIILTLVATLALPFVLRPSKESAAKADETLVLVTPHNEAIRHEYTRGFTEWYRARTGRTVAMDWRVLGGTSEIARFLEGEYVASFKNIWTKKLGRDWSGELQAGFQNPRLTADAPAIVKEARAVFLTSEASCGIDLFFGGGTFDFEKQARAGRLIDSGILQKHPEWFTDAVSDHLGVVHGLQHCEREDDAEGDQHGIRRMHGEPDDKQEQRRDRGQQDDDQRDDDGDGVAVIAAAREKRHAGTHIGEDRQKAGGRGRHGHHQGVAVTHVSHLVCCDSLQLLAIHLFQDARGEGDHRMVRIAASGKGIRSRILHDRNLGHRQA
jgi:hypothetical protein